MLLLLLLLLGGWRRAAALPAGGGTLAAGVAGVDAAALAPLPPPWRGRWQPVRPASGAAMWSPAPAAAWKLLA